MFSGQRWSWHSLFLVTFHPRTLFRAASATAFWLVRSLASQHMAWRCRLSGTKRTQATNLQPPASWFASLMNGDWFPEKSLAVLVDLVTSGYQISYSIFFSGMSLDSRVFPLQLLARRSSRQCSERGAWGTHRTAVGWIRCEGWRLWRAMPGTAQIPLTFHGPLHIFHID